MDCLESPDLRGSAARRLGEYGSIRSAARLRDILAEDINAYNRLDKSQAAHTLGDLRDDTAVALLEKVAAEHPDNWVVRQAVSSLGLIGNLEAESALGRLLQYQKGEDFKNMVLEALLCCGSEAAVAIVVKRAKASQDGPNWLCERIRRLAWTRGWRQGEYYTHIHTSELIDYLESQYEAGSPEQNWRVVDAFRQIDSPPVRELLRKWGSRRGSSQDPLFRENDQRRLSDMCYEELRHRGDESAIGYTLDERADEKDDIYVIIDDDLLRPFQTVAVAEQIRLRLMTATTASETLRMLALLGRFGEKVDAELASRFQDHPDDLVANVACEAMLRLSDSMLVPDRWREM
jgi:HEAT repeats